MNESETIGLPADPNGCWIRSNLLDALTIAHCKLVPDCWRVDGEAEYGRVTVEHFRFAIATLKAVTPQMPIEVLQAGICAFADDPVTALTELLKQLP